jgi:hypothetical protein
MGIKTKNLNFIWKTDKVNTTVYILNKLTPIFRARNSWFYTWNEKEYVYFRDRI